MCHRRRTSAAEILKRGTVLHFIYIYIKHMGFCFYTDWSLFQIYNGYQIKKKQLYTANIANQVTPLISGGQSYVVF